MPFDPDQRHRRSLRLLGYDYSQTGAYFVTLCAQDRACLFGEIAAGQMLLNDVGRMISAHWEGLAVRFGDLGLDQSVVMPNHLPGVVLLGHGCRGEPCVRPACPVGNEGDHKDRPYGTGAAHPRGTLDDTLGRVIQAFKSITTGQYVVGVKRHGWAPFEGRLWQRNHYEHVIRDDDELNRIRQYVLENPLRWADDSENPAEVRS